MSVYTLQIDGVECAAGHDQTLLEVARESGIAIPTLCHLDGLCDVGACRLCVVEVEGSTKLLPACTTTVAEGMSVTTSSERLDDYRRTIVEMLFVERNHVCAVCVASHERFAIDHNRCIMCTRCVRVCDEIEGAHTWDVMGRGLDARVVTDLGTPWGESPTCTSCGKCVQVCPTGALFEKGRPVASTKASRPFLPYLKVRGGAES